MFGKNKLIGTDFSSNGENLQVHSVFPTIQGEGPFAGQACVFLRLAYCNLRCEFCDTDFETDIKEMGLLSILEKIGTAFKHVPKSKLLVITGGEPMRQNIAPLIKIMTSKGYKVQIETAGTVWPPQLTALYDKDPFFDQLFTLVVSPKTGKLNKNIIKHAIYFKYIISYKNKFDADGLPIMKTQAGSNSAVYLAKPEARTNPADIFLSPMDEQDEEKNLANNRLVADLAMEHGYTAGLQLHKYMSVE